MSDRAKTQDEQIGVPTVVPCRSATLKKTKKQRREEFLQKLRDSAPKSLKAMWADSKRQGTDKMTMREIDAVIAEVRTERRAATSMPARGS